MSLRRRLDGLAKVIYADMAPKFDLIGNVEGCAVGNIVTQELEAFLTVCHRLGHLGGRIDNYLAP